MANIGFTHYDTKPASTKPGIQELLAGLTGEQRGEILNGFSDKIIPKTLGYKTGIDRNVIRVLYRSIDSTEERSRSLMRGEVIVTPAVVDPETGEEITPAVYNTPPATAGALLIQIQDDFSEYFTPTQVQAILTKMVQYSKSNGSGDWTYYKTNVIL